MHAHGFQILHVKLRGHGADFSKTADSPHRFIQPRGDDSAMRHAATALVPLAQNKSANDLVPFIVLHEGQFHPVVIRTAAPKAEILWIGRQRGSRLASFRCRLCALHSDSSLPRSRRMRHPNTTLPPPPRPPPPRPFTH